MTSTKSLSITTTSEELCTLCKTITRTIDNIPPTVNKSSEGVPADLRKDVPELLAAIESVNTAWKKLPSFSLQDLSNPDDRALWTAIQDALGSVRLTLNRIWRRISAVDKAGQSKSDFLASIAKSWTMGLGIAEMRGMRKRMTAHVFAMGVCVGIIELWMKQEASSSPDVSRPLSSLLERLQSLDWATKVVVNMSFISSKEEVERKQIVLRLEALRGAAKTLHMTVRERDYPSSSKNLGHPGPSSKEYTDTDTDTGPDADSGSAGAPPNYEEALKETGQPGTDLMTATNDGWTALHTAASKGHTQIVAKLLDSGADPTTVSTTGRTALYSAAEHGHTEVVRLLLAHGGAEGTVNIYTHTRWTPLHAAAAKGHTATVKLLLEHGADVSLPNVDGWTPLNSATRSGYTEIVARLLKHKANPNIPCRGGRTPLYNAVVCGYDDTLETLLKYRADSSIGDGETGTPPLIVAASRGFVVAVRILLKYGAKTDLRGKGGWTAIHSACGQGHLDVVRELLDHGADIGIRTGDGQTPVYTASVGGWARIVDVLLDRGANVDDANEHGFTCLNAAADKGHTEVVRVLLARGGGEYNQGNPGGKDADLLGEDTGASGGSKFVTGEVGLDILI